MQPGEETRKPDVSTTSANAGLQQSLSTPPLKESAFRFIVRMPLT